MNAVYRLLCHPAAKKGPLPASETEPRSTTDCIYRPLPAGSFRCFAYLPSATSFLAALPLSALTSCEAVFRLPALHLPCECFSIACTPARSQYIKPLLRSACRITPPHQARAPSDTLAVLLLPGTFIQSSTSFPFLRASCSIHLYREAFRQPQGPSSKHEDCSPRQPGTR